MTLAGRWRSLSKYGKRLIVLFVCTLPLVNPWVRGDGVGYYAYVRSLLIHGNLRFEDEWRSGNLSFIMNRVDEKGNLKPDEYTRTGYVDNHFSVGPSILWAPFLIVVHLAVLGLNRLGAHILANGYSLPYTVTMAMATALYGFVALWLAFKLACVYFEERWAFLATLGIWFASSLPVYMYFNPSWSHAHSAFIVSLFLWYWHRTRERRTVGQWLFLGMISGLMLDVYYPNAIFLLVPLLESLRGYWRAFRASEHKRAKLAQLFAANLLFATALVLAFLPTLVTRQIIYGSPFQIGYYELADWKWTAPALWSVLFSSNHGLLSWTPILLLALLGLVPLWKYDKEFTLLLTVCAAAFGYLIADFPNWHGLSSFGNRFFICLTPVFVVGLTATFSTCEKWWRRPSGAWMATRIAVALFIAWNLGFIFQWGTHLVPPRGPISWREMAYNQVAVVPVKLAETANTYLFQRRALMRHIEEKDVEQLKRQQSQEK